MLRGHRRPEVTMTHPRSRKAALSITLPLLLVAIAFWPPAATAAPAAAAVSTAVCPTPPFGVQSHAPGAGKTVALTFDDGPGPTTMQLLTVLQRYGVPATFFNIGANAATRGSLVRGEATDGFALGNHTWDHPNMTTLTAAAQGTEMDRTTSMQIAQTGQPSCLFRPPGGNWNNDTLNAAFQRRMAVWNWSVDTEDWKANGSADQFWVDRITSLALAGGSQQHPVILMHNQVNGTPATVAALPAIIEYYQSHGYTFVDLNGHAGLTKPAPASAVTNGGTQVVVRGDDGGLLRRTGNGGTWTGWTALSSAQFDGPSAVALDATTTGVFVEGTDNHVYTQAVPDSGSPGGWTDLSGVVTTRPAAAIAPNGTVSVIARGTDGAAWIRERTGGAWGPWSGLGGYLTSPFAGAATAGNELTVGAVGGDSAVWVRTRTGSWSAWHSLTGIVNAEPALSATAGGAGLVVVVRGTDNGYWLRVGDVTATTWGPWTTISGILISAPSVVVDGTHLVVFGYGTNGQLYQNVATNGAAATGWSGWQPIPA
jgi:peptidoglycan/xylan/chitin deacetylase (PgdA/CDA1 family)